MINEGVLGFWKGNLPAEIMYLIYGGVQFSSYTAIKKKLSSAGPHDLVSLISGGLSGTIATAISYPFDTIRTRLAADSTKGFQNLGNIIRKVYAQESIYGFYGGIRPTIYQIFLGTATSFWTYEKLRQLQGVGGFETAIVPASGFLAGSVSKLVTFPLDSIKRRLQVTGSSRLLEQGGYTYLKKGSYSSNLFTVAYKIIRNEGVLSLYRGAGLTLVKSGIATSLSFSMYELVVGYLK